MEQHTLTREEYLLMRLYSDLREQDKDVRDLLEAINKFRFTNAGRSLKAEEKLMMNEFDDMIKEYKKNEYENQEESLKILNDLNK